MPTKSMISKMEDKHKLLAAAALVCASVCAKNKQTNKQQQQQEKI